MAVGDKNKCRVLSVHICVWSGGGEAHGRDGAIAQ